ncbi:MAG: hypothetical protein Q7U01_06360, partial [Pseudomonas sp.]|nr:hypothetical protein [Pseudomonas sp.]
MPNSATAASDKPSGLRHWSQFLRRQRQVIGVSLTLLLFGIALFACRHLLQGLDPAALHRVLLEIPRNALLGAVACTVLGFLLLLGYEWSASRYAGVKLP